MSKIFAILAVLLIATGAILIAVPREAPAPATRGVSAQQVFSLYARARDIAEQVNAPLSILFGIVSLWYSRRRYIVERDGHGKPGAET